MELTNIKILFWHDEITVFTCAEHRGNAADIYFFCLLNEGGDYIGVKLSNETFKILQASKSDMRKVYADPINRKYIGRFSSGEYVIAYPFIGEMTEEMLPAEGFHIP